eukprot:CAMPEP_0194269578 /NCGR_PEP_ID=MMETSP0169-20130528/3712_1 /TAXON_ID=218684 /ORGANISM="Corethron pennatum, Strain L29A3" /LENGTH=883 /DNA_ID=CAMNT_0039011267 /DNA_START=24 /DNA_END=2672 /DNA_ORIENTATION=+
MENTKPCTAIHFKASISKDKASGPTYKIGIEFRLNGDDVIVSSITAGGPASKSGLKIGDQVCSANGVDISMPDDVLKILDELEMVRSGVIQIDAKRHTTSCITAFITKDSISSKIGLFFKGSYWGTIISNITDGGESSKANLKVGDKILSINGILPSSIREVSDILERTTGRIDITVERPSTGFFSLRLAGKKLKNVEYMGKSDPFYEITALNSENEYALVYKSEYIANDLNPSWNQGSHQLGEILTNGNLNTPIKIDFYDWTKHKTKKPKSLGSIETSVAGLLSASALNLAKGSIAVLKLAKGSIEVLEAEITLEVEYKAPTKFHPKYVGELDAKGMKKGEGTMTYSNGEVYTGNWWGNMREGHGSYFYLDGSKYDGKWKHNEKEGHGSFFWSNGCAREGGWSGDKMEGHGIRRQTNGEIFEDMSKNGEVVWSSKVTDEYFYNKITGDNGENIHDQIKTLILLLTDIHQARLMYTFLNVSTKMGLIDTKDRKKYTLDSLKNIDTTVFNDHSCAVFKLILKKAVEDDLIDDYNNNILDRKAEVSHTCNSEYIQDIRARIEKTEKRVDDLELKVEKIESNLIDMAQAFNGYASTQRAKSYMSAVVGAMTMGIGGAIAGSVFDSAFSSIVDFGDFDHIESIIKSTGDTKAEGLLKSSVNAVGEDALKDGMEGLLEHASSKMDDGGRTSIVAIAISAKLTELKGTSGTVRTKEIDKKEQSESMEPEEKSAQLSDSELKDMESNESVEPEEDLPCIAAMAETKKMSPKKRLEKLASELKKDIDPKASLMSTLRELEDTALPGLEKKNSLTDRIVALEEYSLDQALKELQKEAEKDSQAHRLEKLASEIGISLDPKLGIFAKLRTIEDEIWPGEKKTEKPEKRIAELE